MKITIIGMGYVGLSLATLISKKYSVVAVDIIEEKVNLVNKKISPIEDKEIQEYLSNEKLDLLATLDINKCTNSDYIIVAAPTNYDPNTHFFNTSTVEKIISQVNAISPESTIVVKSTVPIGFTASLKYTNVIFSPEFLREGKALYDNLYPSRIIVGIPNQSLRKKAEEFATLLADCSLKDNVKTVVIGSTEAESVKLFSNTYLAMRVAYFNELDTFAQQNNLNSREIISGVCMDPRIGDYYNNPSFGYGGYCLPKDTKQLLANYENIPNSLINAIVDSNKIRKKFIADWIDQKIGRRKATVGIYRLIMKSGSDNFRESSIMDIINDLSSRGLEILIYEPTISNKFNNWNVENNFKKFCETSEIILANRLSKELTPYQKKVFCRDIFYRD